jgi:putative endonuclease
MFYVYLLQSLHDSTQRYVGFTSREVEARLAEHNTGKSAHTNKSKPWKIVAYFAFEQKHRAQDFERYLKHGSGYAFANRHLW